MELKKKDILLLHIFVFGDWYIWSFQLDHFLKKKFNVLYKNVFIQVL
jgi:hypothetical protein